eukprot:146615-Lingulodinium_polyedra.AAC.1
MRATQRSVAAAYRGAYARPGHLPSLVTAFGLSSRAFDGFCRGARLQLAPRPKSTPGSAAPW